MNTILLLVDSRDSWSPEDWVTEHGGVCEIGGPALIESEVGWLSVLRNDQILADFDEEECVDVGRLVTDPMVYLLEWNGGVLVEELLRSVPSSLRVAVDNDHGLIVSIHEVVNRPLETWVTARKLPQEPADFL